MKRIIIALCIAAPPAAAQQIEMTQPPFVQDRDQYGHDRDRAERHREHEQQRDDRRSRHEEDSDED